ncbi:MAG: DUF2336 domain-containing protein [Pacificimonas sp.]
MREAHFISKDESIEGGNDRFRRLAHQAGLTTRAVRQHVDALFYPLVQPLSDEQRSLAFAALSSLLGDLAADIVRHGGDQLADLDQAAAVSRTESGPLVKRPGLASALLHRAEEHRLSSRLSEVGVSAAMENLDDNSRTGRFLSALAADEDEELAQRAANFCDLMAARLDGQGQPMLLADELSEDLRIDCAWAVAAALSRESSKDVNIVLSRSVRAALAGRDRIRSAQHRGMQLAGRLEERGDIDGRLLLKLCDEGEPLLLGACLAARTKVSSGTAWGLLMRSEPVALANFLKAAGLGKGGVTQITARLLAARQSNMLWNDALDDALVLASNLDKAIADRLLQYWQLDPRLRAALEAGSGI